MFENVKLVVCDIDRTLRMKGEDMGPLNKEAFRELHRRGILLGLASGRPVWQHLMDHAAEWELGFQFDLIIGMNGGEVMDMRTGECKVINLLSTDSLKTIAENMKDYDANTFVYRDGYMLTTRLDDLMIASAKRNNNEVKIAKDLSEMWAEPTAKILYRTADEEAMIPVEEKGKEIEEGADFYCFKTDRNLLEFQDRRNNKGTAVQVFCDDNGIDMKDVMAFGDAENDLEMLKMAGWSVCLKNGMDDIKAVCDAVTEYDAGHDGFGHYVFDHMLNG